MSLGLVFDLRSVCCPLLQRVVASSHQGWAATVVERVVMGGLYRYRIYVTTETHSIQSFSMFRKRRRFLPQTPARQKLHPEYRQSGTDNVVITTSKTLEGRSATFRVQVFSLFSFLFSLFSFLFSLFSFLFVSSGWQGQGKVRDGTQGLCFTSSGVLVFLCVSLVFQ